MKRRSISVWSGLIAIFLWGLINQVSATQSLEVPNLTNILPVKQVVSQNRNWREYYGEVVAISARSLHLNVNGHTVIFPISQATIFYCNGYSSEWEALRPVSERAYFEAQVYINTTGSLCLVNGAYDGQEGVIHSYRVVNGQLRLIIYQPEPTELVECRVSESARLPVDSSWLQTEQAVYILYNYKREIRAVFVPE